MNEYIIPVRYQNVGYGISVKVAGLETNRKNYKQISLSSDNVNFIDTQLNENNLDISNIVTFDNLEQNRCYTIYARLTTNDNNIIEFSCKMLPQLGIYTVESSPRMKMINKYYHGGSLSKFKLPKEVI